jgi:uncharacterized protein (DUF488 family)
MRLWTIGHSTRTLDEFLTLLRDNDIRLLADIRRYPYSRRLPHFNAQGSDGLANALGDVGIDYRHFEALGGRRNPRKDSANTRWRTAAFKGYADYMETPEFQAAAEDLRNEAARRDTAVMCSEAVWWKCHRGLVADWFKARGVDVLHILQPGESPRPHPWTGAARLEDGRLSYADEPENRLL